MDQDLYEDHISTISEIVSDQGAEESPEHRLGMSIHLAFSALDEIVAMGADPKTREMVQRDLHLLSQIKSRLEWIGTFIEVANAADEKPGKLRIVRNG